MSNTTATCPKCGNQIIPYTTTTIEPTFSNGFTSATIITSDHAMPFCVCSLKPVRHDGNLDGKWHINPENTHTNDITFISESQTSSDSSRMLNVRTRWGGCTDLYIAEKEEGEEEEECYHHICDLDQFIVSLQAIRAKSRSYFYGEFCTAPISKEERLRKITAFQKEEASN